MKLIAVAALLGIASLPSALPVFADDDEAESSLEQSIIRNLTGGAVGGPNIDYRERSPLVIPPARNLPQPGARASVQGTAGWPNDPDQKRGGSSGRGGPRSAVGSSDREARNLTPAEMRRGAVRGAGRNNAPVPTPDDNEMGRALRPNELGAPTIFQSFGALRGGEPPVKFEREPTRTRMTDPPVGMRTPSSAQPYKQPPSTSILKIPNFFDRGTDPNQ